MAKFALECPRCGSLNTASTFIFAKNVIQCGACGEEINVKQSRLISKKCPNPHCGKIVVCDQAKYKRERCPACGTQFTAAATTAEFSMVKVNCPQCYCQLEVNKSQEQEQCPVCDFTIKIKEAVAKEKLVSSGGVSVIKYEGDNETFVWKHPIEDFNMGSRLIVHESQEAVFFYKGKALDVFGAGEYVLKTENLPALKNVLKLPTDQTTPFHAEVYFVNKTVQLGIKWGTDSRVRFIDPETGIPLDIGAAGEMNLQVSDSKKLLIKLVGTTSKLTRDDVIGVGDRNGEYGTPKDRSEFYNQDNNAWANTLKGQFKPHIMTTVKSNLASAIKSLNMNILEVDERLEELSAMLREKLSPGFEEYGLWIPQFYVTNVSLPEDDPNFKRLRSLRSTSYLGVKEAEVQSDLVKAQRQVDLERKRTDLELEKLQMEKEMLRAQTEAQKAAIGKSTEIELTRQERLMEAETYGVRGAVDTEIARQMGMAEAQVMEAKGYNQQDVLKADVQKAYAEGLGQFGANGGGGAAGSGMMSELMNLGIGMAAMDTVGGKMGEMIKGFKDAGEGAAPSSGWKCLFCGATDNKGKFCSECGAPKAEGWDCPSCGAKGIMGKFCSECGAPKPALWDCPHCGTKGNKGKFCSECGKSPEVVKDTWDCSCGAKDIVGKFCSECGNKREDVQ